MTLNRKGFLVQAGTLVGSVSLLTRAADILASTGPYVWRKGAMDGGGYCNAMATDPTRPGHAAAAGDVWGEFSTDNYGELWYPTMMGATSIGAIMGRSVAFSRKTPGLRYYGIGVLGIAQSNQGYLGAVAPGSLRLECRNKAVTFSSNLPDGSAAQLPRAVGNLIAVDHDTGSGIEYLYVLSRQGLMRSTDAGATFTPLGLPAVAPADAWSAMCVCPDGSLLASSFRTTYTGGSQVWRIANPRTAPSVTEDSGAPAVVEDFAVVDGQVYAACGPYGLYRVGSDGSWTPLAAGTFSGCHLSSVTGHSGVLWVGNGIGMSDQRYIAKSLDGGQTFAWTTTSVNVNNTVWGATRTWWLGTSWPGMDKHGYSVSQLAVDPVDPNVCYSAGRSGVDATRDGGATWRPADVGLDGSEIHRVRSGPARGEGWAIDTDWGGIHTLDHWRSCIRITDPSQLPAFHAPGLTRDRNGIRYQVSLANPRQMLVNGVDVGDAYFRSACVTPTDLAVSFDRRIYIGLYGGGVLVGRPA